MAKRNSNIILIILIIISILELIINFKIIETSDSIIKYSIVAYVVIAIIAAILCVNFISKADKKRTKEEVKIIYKNFDKDKADQEYIEKQTKNKAEKVAENFIADLKKEDNIKDFSEEILNKMSKRFKITQGIFFIWNDKKQKFVTANTFAFYSTETYKEFAIGEGINGQVAKNKKFLLIDNVPEDYIKAVSGLGEGTPRYLAFIPVISDDKTIAVIEISSFEKFPSPAENIFKSISNNLAPFINKFI